MQSQKRVAEATLSPKFYDSASCANFLAYGTIIKVVALQKR